MLFSFRFIALVSLLFLAIAQHSVAVPAVERRYIPSPNKHAGQKPCPGGTWVPIASQCPTYNPANNHAGQKPCPGGTWVPIASQCPKYNPANNQPWNKYQPWNNYQPWNHQPWNKPGGGKYRCPNGRWVSGPANCPPH